MSQTTVVPPAKILLIDDDDSILNSVSQILEEEGYTVITIPSGEKLETMLVSYPIDLVITDAWLPGKKGIDIARELKRSHSLPVLVISAHDNIFPEYESHYIDAYIKKPFDVYLFLDTVKNLLHPSAYSQNP